MNEKKEDQPLKKKNKKKWILIFVVAAVAIIYLGISFFFIKHYLPKTTINGISCSGKTVKQLEDITYLRDQIGFENIPKGLVEAALARLEHPEATLKELGESLNPPVGKSGINHWLRKLSEMADKVRQEQGGLL